MHIYLYTSHLTLALLTQGATSNSTDETDETDDRISKCDVNNADVTLRGNPAAVADWLYPVADRSGTLWSFFPSLHPSSSFLFIHSSSVTEKIGDQSYCPIYSNRFCY